MPKDQINTPARRTITLPTESNGLKPGEFGLHFAQNGDALAEGQHWEDTPTLFIGWDRPGDHSGPPLDHGCIQFHMTVAADEILRAAAEITRTREHSELPGLDRFTFSTVTLSRAETQKAIRSVRRARDAAFGADE